jgi:hypothetical protein
MRPAAAAAHTPQSSMGPDAVKHLAPNDSENQMSPSYSLMLLKFRILNLN